MKNEEKIIFYKTGEPYGCFSNFSRYDFWENDTYWPTVEHYFQYNKLIDVNVRKSIREVDSPMSAAKIGRDRNNKIVDNWDEIKDDVMRFAILEKFRQNSDIQKILLSTDNLHIIEHTKNDSYWADEGDSSGKNMLGIILMETREILRSESPG
ncbi:NADAR family protein [Photorhabdus bodei]|uniref:N-glycosidase YbiA n=1 Tax=Photorhabdus bodei TaxID=2029681 RepID=A0A329WS36_9GAMM|nr:NADAR family protein [Photorhabdus bodei]RAX06966.1 swarming motility protein YbiA [Photorhabdus bodei]